MSAVWKRLAAIEHTDVVETEKPAFEDVVALGIFAIHPPGKVEQHFVKNRFQKAAVALAAFFALDLINAPGRPHDDRRIHVAEVPFVSRYLAVGMLVPLPDNEIELALGELNIDQGQWNTVKGEVPGRIPGIFPFVRHRHDPLVVKMTPSRVTNMFALFRRRWLAGIAIEPLFNDVMIKLLAP